MVYIYKPGCMGRNTLVNIQSKAKVGEVGMGQRTDQPVQMKSLESARAGLSGSLQDKINKLGINDMEEKKKKRERAKAIHFDL
jgi:hypothetical protein